VSAFGTARHGVRAQGVALRHHVAGYCASGSERRDPRPARAEEFFANDVVRPRA